MESGLEGTMSVAVASLDTLILDWYRLFLAPISLTNYELVFGDISEIIIPGIKLLTTR